MDPMGRGRKMKKKIDQHIFSHGWLFQHFPTLVVKCWRRDVPLGTLLMVHSLAHHTNSLYKTDWKVEQCLCDFHYFHLLICIFSVYIFPLFGPRFSKFCDSFPTKKYKNKHLVILCDLFGMVKWPFKGLSDLQLGESKGHFESPG